jgi:hypothetical protein
MSLLENCGDKAVGFAKRRYQIWRAPSRDLRQWVDDATRLAEGDDRGIVLS